MKNQKAPYEVDLLQLCRTLLRRIWVMLLVAIIAGGIAYAYSSFFMTPMYSAETMLYVDNRSSSGTETISEGDLSTAQRLVEACRVILNTRSTLKTVIDASGTNYSVEQLREMISSESMSETQVFSVKITCDDPQEAANIANAIADALSNKIPNIIKGSSVEVVDYAIVPSTPSYPNTYNNIVRGSLLGFLLACAVILIRFLSNTKIHDEEYLTQVYDLPVLAAVPHLGRNSG